MVFKCQEDSFLKEFSSKILSCEKSISTLNINGKKEKIEGFNVILEDTILFPEGGGQPCDTGVLDSVEVLQVVRRGAEAVHFVKSPMTVGDIVTQKINWQRRLDHMQQHSGQHLLSAVIERDYGHATTSWWLGEEDCYVELETKDFAQSDIVELEDKLNEYIRKNIPVTVHVYERDDPNLTQSRIFVKGLPADHVGPVRLIDIEGIDSNLCCGTHVTNLAQLQCIKLLSTERGKQGRTNLYFLVGNRVMKRLQACVEREQALTAIVKGGPVKHSELVNKMQISHKVAAKNVQSLLKHIAVLEAQNLLAQKPRPKFFSYHRTEGLDTDFMNILIKEIGTTDIFLFLTVGNDKGAGNMIINGQEDLVQKLGPTICQILDGKGAGKGTRFQAKVSNLKNRQQCEILIQKELNIEE